MEINNIIADAKFITSEIILLSAAILGLILGLFSKERTLPVQVLLVVGMVFSGLHILDPLADSGYIFNGSLASDDATRAFRGIILVSSIISMIFMLGKKMKFEIPILIALSTFGLMLMVSSNDLITLYLTMELSALAMYICVSSKLENKESSEAALKYFILGSISSCIFLFGVSSVSGFAGSLSFNDIGAYSVDTNKGDALPILLIFSSTMILVAFFFKMAAAPFHAWVADVYNGSPWYVSLFLGSASKIAILGLLIRCIHSLFWNATIPLQHLLIVVSVLSMFIGSIGAIMQNDIKRILAYSSIGNIGFSLASIATFSLSGIASGFLYLVLYSIIMFIPSFALVGILTPYNKSSLLLSDLSKLNNSNPYKTGALSFIMLSIAGLPPFAGFFGKFYMLMSIIAQDMQGLSILFILAAVLSSFYCIKIVKSIYFTKDKNNSSEGINEVSSNKIAGLLIFILSIINVLYCSFSSQAVTFFVGLFKIFI